MPKIIPELHEKIVETAEVLYVNNSYAEIDMRKIANACGIAVGTLYNYFPNKEELFTKIFEKSWAKRIEKLQEATRSNRTTLGKLEDILGLIYDDMVQYKGIGNDCFERDIYIREIDKMILLKRMFDDVISRISAIITELLEAVSREEELNIKEENLKRLSITLLFSLPGLMKFFPNKEENIQFLIQRIISTKHG